MQQKIQYSFEGQQYHYDYEKQKIIQVLSRAEIQTQDELKLSLLKVPSAVLLPLDYQWQEDQMVMTYHCPLGDLMDNCIDASWSLSRRLRLALNLLAVEQLQETEIQTLIHPKNIYLDYNDCPYFIYRGIQSLMPPTYQESMLYEIQCFIGSLLTKYSYDDLYEGLINDLEHQSPFMKELLAINDWTQLRPFLIQAYQKALTEEKQQQVVVKRQRFTLFKQLSIWFGTMIILIGVPLIYILFIQLPINNACLKADTSFLSKKYEAVIDDLEKVSIHRIPQTQKYELAYSYVQGKGFDARQRRNIMKNLSLKTEPKYLDYWILDGRGKFDDALSIAKSLEDSNLILYALLQKMDEVKKDKDLKDEKRAELLKQLQEEYKTIQEKTTKKGDKS